VNHLRKRLLVTAVTLALVGGGVAITAVVSATTTATTYYGCASRVGGLLYNVNSKAAPTCLRGDTNITWSQTGPQGPAGVTGAAGLTRELTEPPDQLESRARPDQRDQSELLDQQGQRAIPDLGVQPEPRVCLEIQVQLGRLGQRVGKASRAIWEFLAIQVQQVRRVTPEQLAAPGPMAQPDQLVRRELRVQRDQPE
jgi:hypothetical protein